jgi:hypothetical protein
MSHVVPPGSRFSNIFGGADRAAARSAGNDAEVAGKIVEPAAGEMAMRHDIGRVFAVSGDGEAIVRPAPLAITAAPEVGDMANAVNTSLPNTGEAARALAAKVGAPEMGEVAKVVTTVANAVKDIPK